MNKLLKHLQLKMTLYCTIITGSIFILISITFVFMLKRNIVSEFENSFNQSINSTILHLSEYSTVKDSWILESQTNSGINYYIYNNKSPMFFMKRRTSNFDSAIKEIVNYAQKEYGLSVFAKTQNHLTEQQQFKYKIDDELYIVCVATIPRNNGSLTVIALKSYNTINQKFYNYTLRILLLVLLANICLFTFSWFYTKRMLKPIDENNKKQMLFVASASHELKTPVAVMMSGIDAVKMADTKEDKEKFLDIISKETVNMKHIVEDMLYISQANAKNIKIEKQIYAPELLLSELSDKYDVLAKEKGLNLILSIPNTEIPKLLFDKTQILHVLSIILDNAITYTNCGKIVLSYNPQNKSYSIADSGIGMDSETRKHIFDYFYRKESSHTSKNHYGLGLPTAKKIIDAHGGKIVVKSNEMSGSTFSIYIE